jgi:hypothetical protein
MKSILRGVDYSKYRENSRFYSGSEHKIGITIEGKDWILKFQKNSEIGPLMNHLSEYIGSHIFQMIGITRSKHGSWNL